MKENPGLIRSFIYNMMHPNRPKYDKCAATVVRKRKIEPCLNRPIPHSTFCIEHTPRLFELSEEVTEEEAKELIEAGRKEIERLSKLTPKELLKRSKDG